MKCRSCGWLLKQDSKFCGGCGAPVEDVRAAGVRCPKCGAINPPGSRFCSRDRTPLQGQAPAQTEARPATAAVTAETSSELTGAGTAATRERLATTGPPSQSEPSVPPMRRSRTELDEALADAGRPRLGLVLGTVAVLALASGGYWFYTQRSAPSPVPDTEPVSSEPVASAQRVEEQPEKVVELPPVSTANEAPSVDPSTVAAAPRVNVGDRWVTEVIDHQDAALSYRAERTVTESVPDRIFTSVKTLGKDYVRVVEYTGEWALVATHLRSGATTNYSPALPYLSFPLQPGKTWNARVVETDAEGKQRVHDVSARVDSWEAVRVPAGTFTALKVVLTDDISIDGKLVQQGQDTSWYAPDVRRTVKTEETSFDPATGERRRRTISLIEFALQGVQQSAAHDVIESAPGLAGEAVESSAQPDVPMSKKRWSYCVAITARAVGFGIADTNQSTMAGQTIVVGTATARALAEYAKASGMDISGSSAIIDGIKPQVLAMPLEQVLQALVDCAGDPRIRPYLTSAESSPD